MKFSCLVDRRWFVAIMVKSASPFIADKTIEHANLISLLLS